MKWRGEYVKENEPKQAQRHDLLQTALKYK